MTDLLTQLQPREISNDRPWDAAVLLALTSAKEPEVVFVKRAKHLSTHPGEVALPGGKRDDPDDSPVATALRECQEEIGLNPDTVRVGGLLPTQFSRRSLAVVPVWGIIPENLKLEPCTDESDQVFRTPLRFFIDAQPARAYKIQRNGRNAYIPAWDWKEFEIWGLTARILLSLLHQTGHKKLDLRQKPAGCPIVIPYQKPSADQR